MILCQRHVCYYSERGDLLRDRFVLMMKNNEFHDQRPSDKAKWTSEKQIRCAAIACQFYEAGPASVFFDSRQRESLLLCF